MDINEILKVKKEINASCKAIDELEESIRAEYAKEKRSINNKSDEMISDMYLKYETFKKTHFVSIRKKIEDLVSLLRKDYDDEWKTLSVSKTAFTKVSYEENEKQLHVFLAKINEYIKRLNSVDFDTLVPPVKIKINGESFVTYVGDHLDEKRYDFNSGTKYYICDPKPIRNIVKETLLYCLKAELCIDALVDNYDKTFNINGFETFVEGIGKRCIMELEGKLRSEYSKRFDELFGEEQKVKYKGFFERLKKEGEDSDVDLENGTSTYEENITIGNIEFPVEKQSKHIEYISRNSVLKKYLPNGRVSAPMILNLKQCGNILLNIDEENYSKETINFVNQLIIQFLLSFPVNRIKFCLIDIDDKMEFSHFKSLTKINSNILFNGIIRDSRIDEGVIMNMEDKRNKIYDDVLSFNNVEDIYEYNKRFESNPQDVHLFVLVNYPSGMDDKKANNVLKIIQKGNKAGIFSIIVNNKACTSTLQNEKDIEKFAKLIESIEKSSLVIDKTGSSFKVKLGVENLFVPKNDISVSSLSAIIEMLKLKSEKHENHNVVPLSQMFGNTDTLVAKPEGIPLAGEVLDIPIGVRGGEIQNLFLDTTGKGSPHALVIGGTGSGKSNLLHTIIMSACYKYSPEDLILYIVDFKGGVEFKYYEADMIREKQIPHIKLTGLTSDVEDGVAILSNLLKELDRRGEVFRKNNVKDIVGYVKKGKKMPRLLVIVDEIQELFEKDEILGQKAVRILSILCKQGRAFGVNILWASQNIPKAGGLHDKVLSQIGNRISLKLNNVSDAGDIGIDVKAVNNLNRPEKGLGVIKEPRYGNDCFEFRVAYAEEGDARQKYSQQIINRWKHVVDESVQETLFVVGNDADASPIAENTIYSEVPTKKQVVSKAFDSYVVQFGQDYITGKPYDVNIPLLGSNKTNLLLVGYDVEILRDMMGYASLSVIINHITNADCVAEGTKIYYANRELLNPNNSKDLFNVICSDFDHIIENVSAKDKMVDCVKNLYKIYKERSVEANDSTYAKAYTPYFFVIHSLQGYTDLLNDNLKLEFSDDNTHIPQESVMTGDKRSKMDTASAQALFTISSMTSYSKTNSSKDIGIADAFCELLNRGGEFGIHFIISIDNPFGISTIKNAMNEIMYKVFVRGCDAKVMSEMLGDYKAHSSLSNPKIALHTTKDERAKVKVYRYEQEKDENWYKKLCSNYNKLRGKD